MDFKYTECLLGLKFRDTEILKEALTHSSASNERRDTEIIGKDNERLEFLGDTVLDLVVGEILYSSRPLFSEGDLSSLKAQIVSGESLAGAAKRLELSKLIVFGKGEKKNHGACKHSNLSAALEAIIGAVFIDQGFDTARHFVKAWLSVEINNTLGEGVKYDPKTRLQMILQRRFGDPPTYRVKSRFGPDHSPTFLCEVLSHGFVIGIGSGSTKASAEKRAAIKALEDLDSEP